MRLRLAVGALLVLATLAVFWRVQRNGFIDYDDDYYVTINQVVQKGLTADGIVYAFTATDAANWHPLTWLSHMLDVELFGLEPARHHRSNLILHALDAALLFALLCAMTGAPWPSALAAGLFALHPLHVESVAWVAERKDVLSTLFWILSTWAYVRFTRGAGARHYAGALALFACGLMSKPMLVSLPLTLLLLDFWPLGRFGRVPLLRLLLEKLPFIALALASSAITLAVQVASGSASSVSSLPIPIRLLNAVISYATYLWQTLWPLDLAVFYPYPQRFPHVNWVGSLALLLALSSAAIWQARRRPYLLVGWLWFLVTLLPVIGLVQVGFQARADRYTYVPLIGLFVAAAWAARDVASRGPAVRVLVAGTALALLVLCAARSWQQIEFWRDGFTLFTRAIEVTGPNFIAEHQLGFFHQKRGELDAAQRRYVASLRIFPVYRMSNFFLGTILEARGDPAGALRQYRRTLELSPGFPPAEQALVRVFARHPELAAGGAAPAR